MTLPRTRRRHRGLAVSLRGSRTHDDAFPTLQFLQRQLRQPFAVGHNSVQHGAGLVRWQLGNQLLRVFQPANRTAKNLEHFLQGAGLQLPGDFVGSVARTGQADVGNVLATFTAAEGLVFDFVSCTHGILSFSVWFLSNYLVVAGSSKQFAIHSSGAHIHRALAQSHFNDGYQLLDFI